MADKAVGIELMLYLCISLWSLELFDKIGFSISSQRTPGSAGVEPTYYEDTIVIIV